MGYEVSMTRQILLVEDDQTTADYVLNGLRQDGFTVEHVKNGPDGLYLFAGNEERGSWPRSPRSNPDAEGIFKIPNGHGRFSGRAERGLGGVEAGGRCS